ncbi:ABC transporter ATP-binding protein [Bogoriella caseilytica]|uniref:ABC-type multidrug transport system fused ATPase/permease subunit n=1 Tax=Bogoriella caseilytica TaxID=56055 RepID=A0A3N2BEG2_9MICO|nr:ABC transporter ATP-binding protein [Bogoriella caseilytica]ROR73622.1 ABC-type multidrug transport system fused ATPase/permease subunit [Bogoriella caseilytica]
MLEPLSGHPGHPPLTRPSRYLAWLAGRQKGLLSFALIMAIIEAASLAAVPFLLGRALDDGLESGLSAELLISVAWLVGIGILGAAAAAVGHIGEIGAWLNGAFRTSRLVGHHVTRTGDSVTEEMSTGEVVSTVATDSHHIGNLYELLPRLVGAVVAYLVVAVVVLQQNLALGLAVLIGLPVTATALSLLIKPLHTRQSKHREETGKLTSLGADTVTGLRVLRGIGGEDAFSTRYAEQSQRVRAAGVSVAHTSALLQGLQVLLPGLLVVAVVWFGARLTLTGEITPGQLVSFYGFTAFLTMPLQAATQFLTILTRARVGARKVTRVLATQPAAGSLAESEAADGEPLVATDSRPRELVDLTTGVRLAPGRMTALVSGTPDDAATLAQRLGRLDDHDGDVSYGGVLLSELPVAEVRRRIVVADATPQLFSGVLRDELDVRDTGTDASLLEAIDVAAAHDVLESMPEGLDGEITEKGRSLSGGQRQRVALARAVLTGAETVVLIEPTSAVDAHSEARIADRLTAHRAGLTTVVVTASPLVLDHADEVVFLESGPDGVSHEAARGTHRELIDTVPRYRAVVTRDVEEEQEEQDEITAVDQLTREHETEGACR